MRIYFDNCCYNRPFDDRSQNRIFDEANAVLSIIKRAEDSGFEVIGSSILEYEISLMKDEEKKKKVLAEYQSIITLKVNSSKDILEKAKKICENTNIRQKDALELSSAEAGAADVFLTTDDRLLKMATKTPLVAVRILNPIDFLSELAQDERKQSESDISEKELPV